LVFDAKAWRHETAPVFLAQIINQSWVGMAASYSKSWVGKTPYGKDPDGSRFKPQLIEFFCSLGQINVSPEAGR